MEKLFLFFAGLIAAPLIIGTATTLFFGRRPRISSPVPGLLFHSVQPKPDTEMSHFPLARFEKLCAQLTACGYTGITTTDAATGNPGSPAGKPVLLTFDDGFHSVFEYAVPVLRRHGHRATIFCVAGFYGCASSWDIFSGNRHLTPQEIAAIATEGHEVGSHSSTHAYLPYLTDARVREELASSKQRLEDIIGKPVTSISFPFGGWNRRIWDIARETGYLAATLYRGEPLEGAPLFPVSGVYQFETVDDILDKLDLHAPVSAVKARSEMMTHFSRGTPIWKFRKEYVRAIG